MSEISPVEHPNDASLDQLCQRLAEASSEWTTVDRWPQRSLRLCGLAGVYRWFLPKEKGGLGWSEEEQTRGYLRLAEADLTTTFVITQYMGAIRRIAGSQNNAVASEYLDALVSGEAFATVGISHLTTSRRHLRKPVLQASVTDGGYLLEGQAPWVTGVPHAQLYVVGASMEDGRQILVAVPATASGLVPGRGVDLVALSASCTDRLEFQNVLVNESNVLAGPVENVLQTGVGAGTGGLQTSTLALGLTRAAIGFLLDEATRRDDLKEASEELNSEADQLERTLLRATAGDESCNASDIRGSANRLVLRSTQAALTAAKGAGYVDGHPVGRWCREALFFLVWSCPQPIAQAHLCELAGISQ